MPGGQPMPQYGGYPAPAKKSGLWWLLLLIPFCCIGSILISVFSDQLNKPQFKVVWRQKYGSTYSGDITNVTSRTYTGVKLRIADAVPGGSSYGSQAKLGETYAEPRSFTIAPGETKPFTISLNVGGLRGDQAPWIETDQGSCTATASPEE